MGSGNRWGLVLMGLFWPGAAAADVVAFEVRLGRADGQVTCRLYDSPEGWLKAPIAEDRAVAEGGVAVCRFDGVTPGPHAVSAYHDENRNGRLDTRLFGIPAEPVCVSGGARPRFGPPRWADAVFEHPGGVQRLGCEAR